MAGPPLPTFSWRPTVATGTGRVILRRKSQRHVPGDNFRTWPKVVRHFTAHKRKQLPLMQLAIRESETGLRCLQVFAQTPMTSLETTTCTLKQTRTNKEQQIRWTIPARNQTLLSLVSFNIIGCVLFVRSYFRFVFFVVWFASEVFTNRSLWTHQQKQ